MLAPTQILVHRASLLWTMKLRDGIPKRTGPRTKARMSCLGSISQGHLLLFSLLCHLHANTRHLALFTFEETPSIPWTTLSLFIPKPHYGQAHHLLQNQPQTCTAFRSNLMLHAWSWGKQDMGSLYPSRAESHSGILHVSSLILKSALKGK